MRVRIGSRGAVVPLVLMAICGGAVSGVPARAAGLFDLAVREFDIDEKASKTFHDDESAPADLASVIKTLGLNDGEKVEYWTAGDAGKRGRGDLPPERETFHYLLAFTDPVEIGSVMLSLGELRYLKADAAVPAQIAVDAETGALKDESPWIKPEVIPNQSGVRLVTLPGSTKTKALLISETRRWGRSRLDVLRIFSRRLHNVVPWALANAESEYTRYSSLSPPHTFAAGDIVKGRGSWINTGKDKEGRILRPPTSDVYPSWFVLSWRDEKQIAGMWSNDDFLACDYFYFIGPPNMNPTVGSDKDWKKLRFAQKQSRGNRIQHWIEFDKPITTRGIKMLILKTTEPQVSVIDGCHVLSDLGDAPVPKFQPPVADLAPFRVPYQVPFDGKVTMVVNKPDGTRARNLVTLLERTKGESAEYWDLKDESGKFVEPGTYKWLAIEHPPLELRYEMTPYPNVVDNSPENSAWLNGHNGPGGWMADHTPPDACCTAGDRVWLGSPCAESGVSTIECDLTGKKLWGHHSFAAWTGPQHMATDGKTVFVASSAWGTASDWNI
ncbi:MAG TPA: hypothetical protein VM186_08825, partial [Planctomycetota bacterium]|nr:hypothetical protein [Planctomycetota bacterium]